MVCYSCDEDSETNKYPYTCSKCDYKGRQKSSHNKHEEAIHVVVCYSCDEDIETDKYPYSSSHCDCKAGQKSSLVCYTCLNCSFVNGGDSETHHMITVKG